MSAKQRIDITPGIVQDDTGIATTTILPGSLLNIAGDKQFGLLGAGTGSAPILVALTAPERGKGVSDSYTNGETLRHGRPAMGQVIQCILAASQTVTYGDDLAAAANGQVTQSSTNARLMALEAVTTGAGATALVECTPKQS